MSVPASSSLEAVALEPVDASPTQDTNTPSASTEAKDHKSDLLGIFGRYLSLWVLLCMAAGTAIGTIWPEVADTLNEATFSQISLPVAVLLWVMIFPMALSIDYKALKKVRSQPKPIMLTTFLNWVIQPFFMFALALLFFRVIFSSVIDDEEREKEYVAGAVILGGSPCTAMVFVWSALTHGDAAYTLAQVAVNDAVLLVLYAPTLFLLLGATDIHIPYDTIFLSVFLFIVIPFGAAFLTRYWLLNPRSVSGETESEREEKLKKGREKLKVLEHTFKPFTVVALLLTLLLIFIFQGEKVTDNPTDILLIALPLSLQTYLMFCLAFGGAYYLGIGFDTAAPAAFIASSNFFELGVGVAISAYGLDSGATLVNVVGVLVEVPIMLSLVWIANRCEHYFPRRVKEVNETEEMV